MHQQRESPKPGRTSLGSALFLGGTFLFALGCVARDQGVPDGRAKALKVEDARAALIAMVEASDYSDLKMSLPSLRSDEAVRVGRDEVEIGPWRCDLAERTFVVEVIAEPIFARYQGAFELDRDNDWRAVIGSEDHN